jgi:hypothetical protein
MNAVCAAQNSKIRMLAVICTVLLTVSLFTLLALQSPVSAHSPPWSIPTQSYIEVTPNPVGVGQRVTISFWLNEPPPTANGTYGDRWQNITVDVMDPDGIVQILGPFQSNETGSGFVWYTPTQIGHYYIEMAFSGQTLAGTHLAPGTTSEFIGDFYQPSTSQRVDLFVQEEPVEGAPKPKTTPNLDVSCRSSTSYSNFEVDITGRLTSDGLGISNAHILLSTSNNDGASWTDLSTAITDANGDFSITWHSEVSGSYLVKAVYDGDFINYDEASRIVNFAIVSFQEQSVFSVTSNSTITALYFDSANYQLSFSTNGTSGTTGYVNVRVPTSLINDPASIEVYIDEETVTYTATFQEDAWMLSFTFHQSYHAATINFGIANEKGSQLDPLVIIISVSIVIVFCIGLLVYFKKREHIAK